MQKFLTFLRFNKRKKVSLAEFWYIIAVIIGRVGFKGKRFLFFFSRKVQSVGGHLEFQVNQLASAFDLLCDIWKERLALYEENLDVQKWKRDANVLDSWLNEKEELLSEEWRKVDSVDDADNRIRFEFLLLE